MTKMIDQSDQTKNYQTSRLIKLEIYNIDLIYIIRRKIVKLIWVNCSGLKLVKTNLL